MTTALDAVAAKITNLETKVDAAVAAQTEAVTELKSLRAAVAAVLSGNDSVAGLTAIGDRIDALASKLDTSSSALSAAEVPAATPAPAPAPVDAPAVATTPAPADPTVPPTTP